MEDRVAKLEVAVEALTLRLANLEFKIAGVNFVSLLIAFAIGKVL